MVPKKAELRAQLQAMGENVPESWTIPQIKARVTEVKAENPAEDPGASFSPSSSGSQERTADPVPDGTGHSSELQHDHPSVDVSGRGGNPLPLRAGRDRVCGDRSL